MAKIPRINQGDRPSAVPGGALVGAAGSAAPLAAGLGDLADVGYKIAADEEEAQAVAARDAREQFQAITNEVAASRGAGDYEEGLVDYTAKIQKDMWETPEKAPEALLEAGRQLADQQIKSAPNTAISLDLAQKTASRLDSAMREMHNWALARQTQKAKGDLTVIKNRAAAGAESQPSLAGLDVYIKTKEAELSSIFHNVLGPAAQAEMQDMKTGMAQGWLHVFGDKDPIAGLQALQAKEGPLVDHLNAAQREAGRREMTASFEGLTKTRELETIVRHTGQNRKLGEAFMAGDPTFAGIAFTQRRALEEQKKAVKAQMTYDAKALKALGLPTTEPGDVMGLIDDSLSYIDALEKARRRQTVFDAPDDPTTSEALLVKMNKALNSKNGKDLGNVVRFQKDLAVAVAGEKISGATAATMFKTMSLAMDKASDNNEDVWGPNTWRLWRAPMEAGSVELNRQFGGQFSKLDKPTQQRVRLSYMGQFNTAQEMGAAVDGKAARKMALRALSLETGTHLPGVD